MTRPNATLLAAFALAALVALAAERSPAGPGFENLGDDLMTDGLNDLLEGATPAKDAQPQPERPADGANWGPDQKLLDEMIENNLQGRESGPNLGGEDIGQPRNPLARVERNMGHARQLISRLDKSGETGRVQQQIVDDLEALINQMEKQCSGGQGNNSSQARQQSLRSKPTQQAGKPSARPQASSAAQQSTPRLTPADAEDAQGRPTEDLLKQAWGHLPERLREQMLQSSSSEFLPEYREEIERYFQRLAEEEAGSAGPR